MHTLVIDGLAVAVINADEETARDLFTCDGFKDDIRAMTTEGRPVWNGTSALTVRPASEVEVEEFEDALSEDDEDGAFEPDPHHAEGGGANNSRQVPESQGAMGVEDDEDEADIVFLVDIDEGSGYLDA